MSSHGLYDPSRGQSTVTSEAKTHLAKEALGVIWRRGFFKARHRVLRTKKHVKVGINIMIAFCCDYHHYYCYQRRRVGALEVGHLEVVSFFMFCT